MERGAFGETGSNLVGLLAAPFGGDGFRSVVRVVASMRSTAYCPLPRSLRTAIAFTLAAAGSAALTLGMLVPALEDLALRPESPVAAIVAVFVTISIGSSWVVLLLAQLATLPLAVSFLAVRLGFAMPSRAEAAEIRRAQNAPISGGLAAWKR